METHQKKTNDSAYYYGGVREKEVMYYGTDSRMYGGTAKKYSKF